MYIFYIQLVSEISYLIQEVGIRLRQTQFWFKVHCNQLSCVIREDIATYMSSIYSDDICTSFIIFFLVTFEFFLASVRIQQADVNRILHELGLYGRQQMGQYLYSLYIWCFPSLTQPLFMYSLVGMFTTSGQSRPFNLP